MHDAYFLFIGGPHQVAHLAPVAEELARRSPGLTVRLLFMGAATGRALREIKAATPGSATVIEHVRPPRWTRWLPSRAAKLPLLLVLLPRLRRAGVIVTAERTSAWLKRFGLKTPMIHFRHGAGDRAPKSEARLNAFDLIVVPGAKDVRRAIDRAGIAPGRLKTAGYVKLDHLSRAAHERPPLFANGRPTVLYNPHFDAGTSSWADARAVVAAFARQDRYNLVLAPHVRVAEDMSADERAAWEALGDGKTIIVDLGSPRSFDMTYTCGADIYLGDMSSQLYEFLSVERPVAFLNSHHAAWRADPRYAGWALGEVAEQPDEVIAAIDRAVAHWPEVRAAQSAAVADAFGRWRGAAARGAQLVLAEYRRAAAAV